MIGAGAFVAFGDGYEGLAAVRRMRGDWWELNEAGTILEGTRAGGRIRLGDPMRVRVHSIDAVRGRVDLERRVAATVGGWPRRRRRSGQATSRRIATPRTATTCWSGSSAASCSPAPRSSRCAAAPPSSRTASRRSAAASCGCATSTSRPTRRPAARTTSPSASASCSLHRREIDRLAARVAGARPHARADAHLLLRPAREGRDRARARQGRARQARDAAPPRLAARDRARAARGAPLARDRAVQVGRVHAERERRRSGRRRRRRRATRLRGETR